MKLSVIFLRFCLAACTEHVTDWLAFEIVYTTAAPSNVPILYPQSIEKLPDKVILHIFSYLSHLEICRMATVCRRWRTIAYNTQLWKNVSLRPEVSGLHVGSLESLLQLISVRFGPSLRYIELPIELITHTVLHELSSKCPNLTHMLLDFSTGRCGRGIATLIVLYLIPSFLFVFFLQLCSCTTLAKCKPSRPSCGTCASACRR